MDIDALRFLTDALMVFVPLGVPLIILLVLAALLGRWYNAYSDPPPEAFEEEHH